MTTLTSACARHNISVLLVVLLAGCATPDGPMSIARSPLQGQSSAAIPDEAKGEQQGGRLASGESEESKQAKRPVFTGVDSLAKADMRAPASQDPDLMAFSDSKNIELRLEALPLREFIHRVFDQLLDVSYVIDQQLGKQLDEKITINLQQELSQRELFRLARRILSENKVSVLGREGVYFITAAGAQDNLDLRIGVGSSVASVPDSDERVLQIVPVRFGAPRGFQVVLKSLFQVEVTAQEEKQLLFIQGAPENVRRALDMLNLLDAPASRAQEVGMVDLVYLEPEDFILNLVELMAAEGIVVASAGQQGPVALVALPRRQAVVVFASEAALLQRVNYWARQLDVPGKTTEQAYFLYKPTNARAVDMGESLERLLSLGGGNAASRPVNATASAGSPQVETAQTSTATTGKQRSSGGVAGQDLKMVIDERQNQLMFHATPAAYEKIRPLLKRLDMSPPQVALEVTVAEVTLTGSLQYGLEWFLQKNNYTIGTQGALGIGSSGLNFSLLDVDQGLRVIANLSETDNTVNILSRPRIVVADGSLATVNVGTDIPILTSTASDVSGGELGSTIVQTVQYRSTGVVLNVTPTVNGQGVVSLELSQEISNASDDAIPGINSPVISQRSFKTSLMVGDGQTAVVGGLISDNNASGGSGVPGLSKVPLLKYLFSTTTKGRDKTEIVVMITPRIITSVAQLDEVAMRLTDGMSLLNPQPQPQPQPEIVPGEGR